MSGKVRVMSTIQFKEVNCKNCYKCIRTCPVKAISFKNEQARIIEEACMLCGKCLQACPQNAKSVISDIEKVRGFLNKNEKVYVTIAPSFAAAFDIADGRKMYSALKKLGFTYVEETAVGAAKVSREYEKLMTQKKMNNIITSACASVVFLIEKYYPELLDQLSPVVSPMIAHGKMLREMYGPRIKVVFIGPCLSKKEECNDLQNSGVIDAVITFEELDMWMNMEGITFDADEAELKGIKSPVARFYPVPGGIIKTLGTEERKGYKCISIDGVDRCMEVLDAIRMGEINGYFIEMNTCDGGCLGGPCTKKLPGGLLKSRERLISYIKKSSREQGLVMVDDVEVSMYKKFIDRSLYNKIPGEETIREILSKIGKFTSDQELNCGACGYTSCREKAIAVYNNKAELYMCLPFMRERAESISNIVIQTTPNAIFALDKDLNIQELNRSAQKIFGLDGENMIGRNIFEILPCEDFEIVRETGKIILDKKQYYEKYGKIVEQSILYVEEQQITIALIKDITEEEEQELQTFKKMQDAADIAQKVIDKQMRVVQEIASILGETTAETKVALTKLKKSILDEGK